MTLTVSQTNKTISLVINTVFQNNTGSVVAPKKVIKLNATTFGALENLRFY